jgi:hypothetical protein
MRRATCYQCYPRGPVITTGETVEWRSVDHDTIELLYRETRVTMRVIEFLMYFACD